MHPIWWVLIGFGTGSLPFSLWIGRWSAGVDIRDFGDRNPGATNVLRAGGRLAALVALLLDIAKGILPVALAYAYAAIDSAWLVPIALSPVLGHAFSPLLGGRGGKGVATTGGIWTALTAWEGPTVGGLGLALGSILFGANGWAVMFSMTLLLLYLLWAPTSWNTVVQRPPLSLLLPIWLGNAAILAWTHRHDLRHVPAKLAGRAVWR